MYNQPSKKTALLLGNGMEYICQNVMVHYYRKLDFEKIWMMDFSSSFLSGREETILRLKRLTILKAP